MKFRDIFKYILGGLIVIGFFVLCVALLKLEVPASNRDLFNLLIGSLIAAFSTIVGFFYGSSLGSQVKNEMLTKKEDDVPTT
jgi:vacuolar-type H+-ATPase subunit I/STV1